MNKRWWKEAVIYQIYTRSFYDSNGDGIGDIEGTRRKLDYLKELGVDVLWISPCFESPNADNGYDVSDYGKIQKEFGNLQDLQALIRDAKDRDIKILLDLVLNHTSDEHPWFVESRKSKDNPYRDFYIWRKGNNGKEPNNWGSFFKGSAWEWDETTGEYYLHTFSTKQPDLNWENKEVRRRFHKIMKYWLDMGIAGFRLDAINYIKKPGNLPDSTLEPDENGCCIDTELYANNPGFTDFIREMHQQVWKEYDIMTVGECAVLTPERALEYVDEKDTLFDMVFNVELAFKRENFTWPDFKQTQRAFIRELDKGGWNSQFIQNHDIARRISMLSDTEQYHTELAKMLAALVHTLPGTPYIYQGEEIGMTNARFHSVDEFDDLFCRKEYYEKLEQGWSEEETLDYLNRYSRDQARTPMQWDDTAYSGFSMVKPWMKLSENYRTVNVQSERKRKNGIFAFYQALISLRKANPVLVYGSFQEYMEDNGELYVYTRTLGEVSWLVTINLTDMGQKLPLLPKWADRKFILGNYEEQSGEHQIVLRPYEAVIWALS